MTESARRPSDRPTPILSPPEIEALMTQATPEERDVLVKRFGLDRDHYRTLDETSASVGRSVDDVRSLEESAVSRFSESMTKVAMAPAEAASPDVPTPARPVGFDGPPA